ncbi:hypothetical protein PQX77_015098 [Marasmius sp. AFHP31]|nr:hypothetical protein PQX77_015098 [Marasmius sp. AFHP31]
MSIRFSFDQGDDIDARIFVPAHSTTSTRHNPFATSDSASIYYPDPVLLDLYPLRRGFNATVRSDFDPYTFKECDPNPNSRSSPGYTSHDHFDPNIGSNTTDSSLLSPPTSDSFSVEKENHTDVNPKVRHQDHDTITPKHEDQEDNVPETRPEKFA